MSFRYLSARVRSIGCFLWAVACAVLLDVSAAELVPADALPAGRTNSAAQSEVSNSRRLQPNDILDVSVYQQPDLTTRITIDDRGMVMLPLLGAVRLGGLTLEQATARVQSLYDQDYLVDPKITIQVWQMATLRFTILGQVQRPGTYEFPPNEKLSLLDGIAKGGGYTRLAAPSKITLQRNVGGELRVFNMDAEAMAKDRQNNPFQLQPGDTITVGERVF